MALRNTWQGNPADANVGKEAVDNLVYMREHELCMLPLSDDDLPKVSQERLEQGIDAMGRGGETDVEGGEDACVLEVGLAQKDGELGLLRSQLEQLEEQAEEGGRWVRCGRDAVKVRCEPDEIGERDAEALLVPVARGVDRQARRRLQEVLWVCRGFVQSVRIGLVRHWGVGIAWEEEASGRLACARWAGSILDQLHSFALLDVYSTK